MLRRIHRLLVAYRGEIAIRVTCAEAGCSVAEVLAQPGMQVDAKDLLVLLQ